MAAPAIRVDARVDDMSGYELAPTNVRKLCSEMFGWLGHDIICHREVSLRFFFRCLFATSWATDC